MAIPFLSFRVRKKIMKQRGDINELKAKKMLTKAKKRELIGSFPKEDVEELFSLVKRPKDRIVCMIEAKTKKQPLSRINDSIKKDRGQRKKQ